MKTYDVKCPVCGHLNLNLYLQDSKGSMECEKCGCVARAKRTKQAFSVADIRGISGVSLSALSNTRIGA